MKRKQEDATLINVLRLFSKRLDEFTGESKRSYQKAYTSFQLYVVGHYPLSDIIDNSIVENWLIDNLLQGLSRKTVSFYLEKISSLYTGISSKLIGGRSLLFKDIKRKLKELPPFNYSNSINEIVKKIHSLVLREAHINKKSLLIDAIRHFPDLSDLEVKESLKTIWGCVALKAGVLPNIVKGILEKTPPTPILGLLKLCEKAKITPQTVEDASNRVIESLKGEEPQWFAMRLRPKVKFESIINRFSILSDLIKMPELFYPCEEIAKKIGRKMVWEGKPVIRDVVFFKSHKKDIYPLFTKLYDLAWCYRSPGGGPGNYAAIPTKAMEDFKKALGFLTPDFDVMPSGEMELKAGDKVMIVDGEYAEELAEILKKPSFEEDGNKIFRVKLLNRNGHWDIGIDARLLKRQKTIS